MKNIIRLYSLRDDKMGEFASPVVIENDAVAVRQFGDLIGNAKDGSIYKLHPEDFSIWFIGTMDCASSELNPAVPTKIASGSDFAVAK